MQSQSRKGFSLLELSISITIIAFLVAALVAGQNIKTRLELNQVVEDISNIKTAVEQFETTYGSIPGDMWNAEGSFGASVTENGDGDTTLETGAPSERLLFWQHLALAGLIEGTYDGVSTDENGRPSGSLKNSLFGVSTEWPIGLATHGDVYYSAEKDAAGNGLFTTKEAFDFDGRYDDSNPTTGTIRATDGADAAAEDCVVLATTNYNLSNTSNTPCVLHFF